MGHFITRMLDVIERWFPPWVVRAVCGLGMGLVAVWWYIAMAEIIGVILLCAMATLLLRVAIDAFREQRVPMGDEWMDERAAVSWVLMNSGLFQGFSSYPSQAKHVAEHVIHKLRIKRRRAVKSGEVNRKALEWFVTEGLTTGRLKPYVAPKRRGVVSKGV